jgi:hypothetical protein
VVFGALTIEARSHTSEAAILVGAAENRRTEEKTVEVCDTGDGETS